MEKQFLDRLPPADRLTLVDALKIERYADGQSVLLQNDETDDVFFVLSGAAVAETVSPDGKPTIFRSIGTGAIFGELSAIDRAPRSTSVEGRRDLEIGRLPRAQFMHLVDSVPSFRWALLEHLTMQARNMTDRIFEYSTMLVAERIIAELIRLGEAAGEVDGYAKIRPAPKHQELAARISTHREAVSREMSSLTKMGLISKDQDNHLSIDLNGLRGIRYGSDRSST